MFLIFRVLNNKVMLGTASRQYLDKEDLDAPNLFNVTLHYIKQKKKPVDKRDAL